MISSGCTDGFDYRAPELVRWKSFSGNQVNHIETPGPATKIIEAGKSFNG